MYAPRPLASAGLRSCVLRPRPLASVPVCCGPPLPSAPVCCGPPLPSVPVYAPRPLALSAAALPYGAGPSIAFVRPLSSGAGAATLSAAALRSAVLCAVAPLLRPSRMAQVPPLHDVRPSIAGAGPMAPWRRSVFIEGACAANVASVLSNGAGPIGKIGPAPESWETCTGELGDLHRRVGRPAPRGWETCATLWKGTEPVAALPRDLRHTVEGNRTGGRSPQGPAPFSSESCAALPRDLRRTVGKLFSQGGGLSHSGYSSHEKKLPILLKSLSGAAIWRFL